MNHYEQPVIFIVSDSIGETAELLVNAVISQFPDSNVAVKRIPHVTKAEHAKSIAQEASSFNCVIILTSVLEDVRNTVMEDAKKYDIPVIDVMSPMLEALSVIMPAQPRLEPGLGRQVDSEYFQRIAALEFAVQHDDGKNFEGLKKADLVLIGVSRTSKTPLSMYLARKNIKVANVPLMLETEPPEELFLIDPQKIIGLTIDPFVLNQIRTARLSSIGVHTDSSYVDMDVIIQELEYSEAVMKRLGCPVFDVSNKAVEEIASKILQFCKKFREK